MPSSSPRPGSASYYGKLGLENSSYTPEAYYTNEEISVVHEIVVAAQACLDNRYEADPVPTSALFQAYDAILPVHGIDPEDDQHISRLLFRIGGERGEGTLLDKLGSVLSRPDPDPPD
ncbi:unnamed protein product [Parascedosporium putredinis]|uniref:Uncharacterized protein n=1 Tax=Parascedosporium putredinis TaxID=1442378 RepID=A0A9P1GXM2_9PEZI|nr:unnamed protein product [Parascedosporium putredinis]CAI7989171.1 unnamed protein product [Parascedosporium putredinis]